MKTQYNTKNRQQLLNLLEQTKGKHVSVQEICAMLRDQETPMGTTTVYRQLERMVEDGLVNKYVMDGNGAYFEYVGDHHCDAPMCFHCKCEKCGKLIYLHCDEMAAIASHITAHHGFQLDRMKTVFYGTCEDCQNEQGKDEDK